MKYAIIIPDGAADEPLKELGGKTPLEAANTPNMDAIARAGRLGTVRTMAPPSATAGAGTGGVGSAATGAGTTGASASGFVRPKK